MFGCRLRYMDVITGISAGIGKLHVYCSIKRVKVHGIFGLTKAMTNHVPKIFPSQYQDIGITG